MPEVAAEAHVGLMTRHNPTPSTQALHDGGSVFTRLGRFTVRRRRLVLILTVAFVALAGVFGAGAFGKLQGGGFDDPSSESARARQFMEANFTTGDPNVVLLLTARSGDVDSPDVAAIGRELTSELAAAPDVSQVVSYWAATPNPPLRSIDGSKAIIIARLDDGDDQVGDVADLVDRVVASDGAQSEGAVGVQIGGRSAVGFDLNDQIGGDLATAESISVPITLILLVLVFGGLVAAGLPLLVALVSVAGTFLSLAVIGSITDVSIYSINLTTALGLGLAIDYSLFTVSRFREELQRGLTPHEAVVRTVETAGRTIAFSAFVVAASLIALLVFPLYFLRSFAYSGISVVLIAAAAAVISLPALLAVIGQRVNRFSFRRRRATTATTTTTTTTATATATGSTFWHRLAQGVMRRPIPVALGTIALLVALGTPFLRVNFGLPTTDSLPKDSPAREVADQLKADFQSDTTDAFAIVAPTLDASTDSAALDHYAAEVSALTGVARVATATGTYEHGSLTATADDASAVYAASDRGAYLSVTPSVVQRSSAGEALVEHVRALHPPFETGVEGPAAELIDTKQAIADRLPLALGLVALITFVILFLVFGSVLVPIKAIVLNLLSLTATFGAMVWIFQDGHLSGLLDFTADGTLNVSMPILMFCIAFGLSMDYEVFLLSRIKEEYDRSHDNTSAVALGLERTGRIVTAAAALLAVTFAAFGTSGVSFIKMFGLGLALAVVMDATIIRGLLVPAFMRLAGDANWWAPRWMRWIHDRIGISESAPSDRDTVASGEIGTDLGVDETNAFEQLEHRLALVGADLEHEHATRA